MPPNPSFPVRKAIIISAVVLALLLIGAAGAFAFVTGKTPFSAVSGLATSLGLKSESCDMAYQRILQEHGRSYDDCGIAIENGSCDAKGSVQKNVVVVFDSSGSMNATINGETKLALAKRAVSNFMLSVDPSVSVATVVYGHKGSNAEADKPASCQGVETIARDANAGSQAIAGLSARGWTPIAGGLNEAGRALSGKGTGDSENLVVLVTDGEETCGGDPEGAARALLESGLQAKVNVIAFDLSSAEEASLRRIASAGGGTFASAKDGASLEAALGASEDMIAKAACTADRISTVAKNQGEGGATAGMCMARAADEYQAIQAAILSEAPSCASELNPRVIERQSSINASIRGQLMDGFGAGIREQEKAFEDFQGMTGSYDDLKSSVWPR